MSFDNHIALSEMLDVQDVFKLSFLSRLMRAMWRSDAIWRKICLRCLERDPDIAEGLQCEINAHNPLVESFYAFYMSDLRIRLPVPVLCLKAPDDISSLSDAGPYSCLTTQQSKNAIMFDGSRCAPIVTGSIVGVSWYRGHIILIDTDYGDKMSEFFRPNSRFRFWRLCVAESEFGETLKITASCQYFASENASIPVVNRTPYMTREKLCIAAVTNIEDMLLQVERVNDSTFGPIPPRCYWPAPACSICCANDPVGGGDYVFAYFPLGPYAVGKSGLLVVERIEDVESQGKFRRVIGVKLIPPGCQVEFYLSSVRFTSTGDVVIHSNSYAHRWGAQDAPYEIQRAVCTISNLLTDDAPAVSTSRECGVFKTPEAWGNQNIVHATISVATH